LKSRNLTDKVLVGAIDGSCSGVADVKDGKFVATVMQFPKKMAEQGVQAVVTYAKDRTKPSGFVNTGEMLITDTPVDGIESEDTTWGAENCWG
jgi:fructose transport system substrate-binding protein